MALTERLSDAEELIERYGSTIQRLNSALTGDSSETIITCAPVLLPGGGTRTVVADIRIIAATNRKLKEMVTSSCCALLSAIDIAGMDRVTRWGVLAGHPHERYQSCRSSGSSRRVVQS